MRRSHCQNHLITSTVLRVDAPAAQEEDLHSRRVADRSDPIENPIVTHSPGSRTRADT
jgi:hypothetical protein